KTYVFQGEVTYRQELNAGAAKECIREILREQLYNPEEVDVFSDEGFDRYKLIVQVVVGEQRGEGVNCYFHLNKYLYKTHLFFHYYSVLVGQAF
uniref:Uncharacterized protein n=1 Tax=Cyprinus carpio carpio TaxID=630221 RepID=A0A9J8DCF5_CYPCA